MTSQTKFQTTLEAIGVVRSPAIEPVDQDWGRVTAEIHLNDELAPGLRGLEQFSHAIIVFLMHRATFEPATDLVRRPQGRPEMPQIGIFAQRAKHRPNPIGVTAVQILDVADNVLKVKGLDAIDGTPILDIKPYFPLFDRLNRPATPPWVDELMQSYF